MKWRDKKPLSPSRLTSGAARRRHRFRGGAPRLVRPRSSGSLLRPPLSSQGGARLLDLPRSSGLDPEPFKVSQEAAAHDGSSPKPTGNATSVRS